MDDREDKISIKAAVLLLGLFICCGVSVGSENAAHNLSDVSTLYEMPVKPLEQNTPLANCPETLEPLPPEQLFICFQTTTP